MIPPRDTDALHHIRSLRFDIEGPDEAALLTLRARLAELCDGPLAKRLGEVFDDLAAPDEFLEIPRLDVYLGDLGTGNPDPAAIAAATRRALLDLPTVRGASRPRRGGRAATGRDATLTGQDARRQSLPRHRRRLYLHYLLHGDFGAEDPHLRVADLAAVVSEAPGALDELLRDLATVSPRRRRAALGRLLATAPEALRTALLRRARDRGSEVRSGQLPRAAAAALAGEVFEALWPSDVGTEGEGPAEGPGSRADDPAPEGDARALVRAPNAGMVLLAAFLPQLFARAGLLEAQQFRDIEARITAAQLLHYLASGEVSAEEPLLVVPRLLCGLESGQALVGESTPAASQLALVDTLIDSAIGHWTKLGNTSREGLRETFLSRPGVLKTTARGMHIVVERRGVDVLLGSMPWALSPVRLPWLARTIPVDWQ